VSLKGGWYNSLRPDIFMCTGAYFGVFLIVLYTGRQHYISVFRKSLFLKARDEVRPHEVWGARLAILGFLAFVLVLALVGVRLHWAVFYAASYLAIYVAVGRIVAETGLFLIHPHIFPTVLLWGFAGSMVLGPQQMLLMFVVGSVLALGMHVNVLPMVDQGLELSGSRPGRTAAYAGAAFAIALAVAIPIAIYFQYDRGFQAASDGWTRGTPRYAFEPVMRVENRLTAQGALEGAGELSGLDWVRGLAPHWPLVAAFVIVLALTIGTEAMRLRFPRWPIHPILFMCGDWWHSRQLAVSFLIGWFIKRTVMRYGSAATYRRLRPLMFGLIAGDMLAGITLTIAGAVYHYATGVPPKGYWVLPG
jgi:hypothetical protein